MKIISTAPCRISLLGGGTDVHTYSDKFGGVCINMAINIRQKVELNVPKTQLLQRDNPKFFKEFIGSRKVAHFFPGEIESGLGSSAALAVSLLGAKNELKGLQMSKGEIAEKAYQIEVNKLKMFGGRQDQYCSSFGGVNLMEFEDGKVTVTPLNNFVDKVLPSLLLFHIGENRRSTKIQEGFKELTSSQEERLHSIKDSVIEGAKIISSGDIKKFGQFMDKYWQIKKTTNKGITNDYIDQMYDEARYFGAYGGKLLGSGGGGHMLFVVDPDKREEFKRNTGLKWVDFAIDYNGLETRIV